MISLHKITLIGFIFYFCTASFGLLAQTTQKVHSHNDYEQTYPFWLAYTSNAASIEIDVFLKDNKLYVTHQEDEIIPERTIERLYLEPIKKLANTGELRELQLLIDLKSEAYTTLADLIRRLEKYPSLINNTKLTIVISGNRPLLTDYKNYPNYINFDYQDLDNLEDIPLAKIALVSYNFKKLSSWNGYGRMVSNDLEKVKQAIKKANAVNKPFRFWATPDTKTAWASLANLGVDYINTDKPTEAFLHISSLSKNTYTLADKQLVYKPLYKYKQTKSPKNIILMIGDGNGLAQISAAMIANRGALTLTQIKNIGLSKTAAADALNTDSAAGATAIATGNKTNNRAIGVDANGKAVPSLVEILSEKNYQTGIISTDAIYGATPAAFYAHQNERDFTTAIVDDLTSSKLNFFIAGGENMEATINKKFTTKNLIRFSNTNQPTAVYLGEKKAPPYYQRDNMLSESLTKALEVVNKSNKPFFLMVEAAQIDNAGHANNIEGIIEETLDFDSAIATALRFADKDKNTLVIITADHETSGLGIAGGDQDKGILQADFLTIDHTGIMVPVFAYGPKSEMFSGVYENTEIFKKIKKALKIER